LPSELRTRNHLVKRSPLARKSRCGATLSSHEEFLELAAAATSGELTQEERRKLDEHLAGCASCRETTQQLESTIRTAIPALAAGVPQDDSKTHSAWSQDRAEARLFECLDGEEQERDENRRAIPGRQDEHHRAYFPSRIRWDHLGLSSAAIALFALGLGITAYRISRKPAVTTTTTSTARASVLEEQLADAGHEARTLTVQITERDQVITHLREEMQRESEEVKELEAKVGREAKSAQSKGAENSPLLQENKRLGEEMKAAEGRYAQLQKDMEDLQRKRSEEAAHAESLETRVAGLSDELHGKEETIARQQEYLEHDRDIRELVGARDLYIAEIYDVERSGQTNKPYGRVFYTRGKSLVFYAYDLDQQAGLKEASTFQAWGRRGSSSQQALNLGVFYEDSAAKKRWVMRSNDAKTLQEIEAVFVTVEPNGGSPHPSTQPLLFAYLRVHPNHP
jgi:anti-sigma factor RsiW